MNIVRPRWLITGWILGFIATMSACVAEFTDPENNVPNEQSFRFAAFYINFWPRPFNVKDKSTEHFDPCYDRNGNLVSNPN